MKTWLVRGAWLALAAIAGLTSWLVIANQGGRRPSAAATAKPLPTYKLRDAVITRYAPSGRRQYILHSQRITHRRASDTSFLTGVSLDYYPASSPYWHLRAERGRLTDHANRVALFGHVRAHQPKAAKPMHLATSRLRVELREHRIRSDARVTLWQGARETRGIGLRADLRRGVVKLLRDVTSRYVQ